MSERYRPDAPQDTFRLDERCLCCAHPATVAVVKTDSGVMHFDCWLEYHSDPSGIPSPGHPRHEKGASDDQS